jgi:hypothetical protein
MSTLDAQRRVAVHHRYQLHVSTNTGTNTHTTLHISLNTLHLLAVRAD